MRTEEQFDSFYLKTRRALVHQTFALTGDLNAAQRAVRDAYVAAWHHWRKVSTHDDPRDWVRPRAWVLAQRRHTARLWHRTKGLREEDRRVLDALHKLPVAERRTLLMVRLAAVPAEVAARELSLTQAALERLLESATSRFCGVVEIDPADVRPTLLSLADAAASVSLPRPGTVRREGRRRRRIHTVAAAVAVTLLAVGSGAVAHEPRPAARGDLTQASPVVPLPEEESTLPSADDLLDVRAVSRLAPAAPWQELRTHDNTGGDGINTVCQQERFADPDGLAAIVREFAAAGKPSRRVVQTVEISESGDEAAKAYDKAVGWFSGCPGGELHVRKAYQVTGVGDRAMLLALDGWGSPRTSYAVAIAAIGQVVTSTVVETVHGEQPPTRAVVETLAEASRRICVRARRSGCVTGPGIEPAVLGPSGDEPGILTSVDLPGLPGVEEPWVGTSPAPARRNPAATSCDRAEFARQGAARTRTRTFLVPRAPLPDRFGLTETYGTFRSERAAADFLKLVRQRLAGCEERDLATEVLLPHWLREGRLVGSTWRLRTELSERSEVVFDVGFVRRGAHVAQVTFIPAGNAQLSVNEFRAVVVRAGERLRELG